MSDTPRTDRDTRTYQDASVEWQEELVPACACRIIERELNAANDRIKQLEEAGDVCLDMSFRGMHVMAERNWRKAKEAKQ